MQLMKCQLYTNGKPVNGVLGCQKHQNGMSDVPNGETMLLTLSNKVIKIVEQSY